jgi:hypothetical protein
MSNDDDLTLTGMQNSLFLDHLEKWIDDVISQDGLTDIQIIAKVKESFNRSMKANIDYHNNMAKNTDTDINIKRHTLMAEIYEGLLR